MPMFCISIQTIPAVWIPEPDAQHYQYWFINNDVNPPTRQPITFAAITYCNIGIDKRNAANIFSYNSTYKSNI